MIGKRGEKPMTTNLWDEASKEWNDNDTIGYTPDEWPDDIHDDTFAEERDGQ